MTSIQSICVYCSASNAVAERYKALARQTGKLCAAHNWNLVYGGGSGGLMGALADSALESGVSVTGIIPDFLVKKEAAHTGLSHLQITQTLHERQTKMADLSDAFIILPGGMGTLAEFFEVLTWKQLELHTKPIILVNTHGFWDGLLAQLECAQTQQFLYSPNGALFKTVDSLEEIPAIFRSS